MAIADSTSVAHPRVSGFQALEQDFQQTPGGLDIVFDAKDDILLSGVSQVVAGDFVFT